VKPALPSLSVSPIFAPSDCAPPRDSHTVPRSGAPVTSRDDVPSDNLKLPRSGKLPSSARTSASFRAEPARSMLGKL
jgi:hypothetical protein